MSVNTGIAGNIWNTAVLGNTVSIVINAVFWNTGHIGKTGVYDNTGNTGIVGNIWNI